MNTILLLWDNMNQQSNYIELNNRIDMTKKLLCKICASQRISPIVYFDINAPSEKIVTIFQLNGFLIKKALKPSESADSLLIADALSLHSDNIAVVTGDGDFADLAIKLSVKKRVIGIGYAASASKKLISCCEYYYWIP
jgi:uncharacterized LabA/DUF88 family protein